VLSGEGGGSAGHYFNHGIDTRNRRSRSSWQKQATFVIQQFAHKLDMLRDGANGAPPMHPEY